ncbi:hypothetical protein L226DRAFT_261355 [Lentinus tigrinus ALCF2SS1-7]|uniref:uncharacterized protein n=1 Tax=Lentinus tigrinus ALCF2SS1-7 TaxID=1328758 RepID=UPI001165D41F|nr:hypothetical protein L226DRAFT_348248 [Lentinus tigrinus ALCF2SS1-7]RPD70069.1 hypothetical protein L226DRAFT_261355 [Lentinus tigrinus ALCF2SS1-7]
MALFKESQSLGVVPNIFMYNTVISKLVKARKADSIVEHARRSVYGDAARTSVPDGFCVHTFGRSRDVIPASSLHPSAFRFAHPLRGFVSPQRRRLRTLCEDECQLVNGSCKDR